MAVGPVLIAKGFASVPSWRMDIAPLVSSLPLGTDWFGNGEPGLASKIMKHNRMVKIIQRKGGLFLMDEQPGLPIALKDERKDYTTNVNKVSVIGNACLL